LLTQKNRPHGCLICNTGVELGMHDPGIRDFVKGFFRESANVMEQCLKRAIAQGELAKSLDTANVATYLITEFRTALMLAASGHSRRDIERHLEVALQVLH